MDGKRTQQSGNGFRMFLANGGRRPLRGGRTTERKGARATDHRQHNASTTAVMLLSTPPVHELKLNQSCGSLKSFKHFYISLARRDHIYYW